MDVEKFAIGFCMFYGIRFGIPAGFRLLRYILRDPRGFLRILFRVATVIACMVIAFLLLKVIGLIIGGIFCAVGIGTYGGAFGSSVGASKSRKQYETRMRRV